MIKNIIKKNLLYKHQFKQYMIQKIIKLHIIYLLNRTFSYNNNQFQDLMIKNINEKLFNIIFLVVNI